MKFSKLLFKIRVSLGVSVFAASTGWIVIKRSINQLLVSQNVIELEVLLPFAGLLVGIYLFLPAFIKQPTQEKYLDNLPY